MERSRSMRRTTSVTPPVVVSTVIVSTERVRAVLVLAALTFDTAVFWRAPMNHG
jgi:hypothetical protein